MSSWCGGAPTEVLGERRWAELAAGSSFYLSWPWLASFERDGLVRGELLAVGSPVRAALPLYRFDTAPWNSRYDLSRLADNGGAAPQWRPQALLGPCAGYGNGVLRDHTASSEQAAADLVALAALVDRATNDYGAAGIPFLDPETARPLHAALPERWVAVLTDVEVSVRIPPGGFDAWLAALPSSRRSVVRRDLARIACPVRTTDAAHAPPGMVDLVAQVQRRHGATDAIAALPGLLNRWVRIGEHLPAPVFTTGDAEPRAVSIGFVWGDTLYMRAVGIDYAAVGNAPDYFQVLCYEPIRYAAAHGLRRVHLGVESQRAKLLRGGTATPLWTLVRPPAGAHVARGDLVARLTEQLGALLGPVDGEQWRVGVPPEKPVPE